METKESVLSRLILSLMATIIPMVSEELNHLLRDLLGKLDVAAAKTKNPWDDKLVDLAYGIFGFDKP